MEYILERGTLLEFNTEKVKYLTNIELLKQITRHIKKRPKGSTTAAHQYFEYLKSFTEARITYKEHLYLQRTNLHVLEDLKGLIELTSRELHTSWRHETSFKLLNESLNIAIEENSDIEGKDDESVKEHSKSDVQLQHNNDNKNLCTDTPNIKKNHAVNKISIQAGTSTNDQRNNIVDDNNLLQ